ncbi:MAG TPA: hypothetical protein VFS00_22585, partial [Polyangiaceae bacterium]|nr:hypothetical protein [Polyangiaceae bacterium]
VIGSDADCRRAPMCRTYGSCTLVEGECHLTKADDCRKTEQCEKDGVCAYDGTTCVVAADADCRASAACKAEGRCKAQPPKAPRDVADRGRCVKK